VCLVVVYVVWGTSYPAIRVIVAPAVRPGRDALGLRRDARLGVGPTGRAATQCVQSGYQNKNAAGDDEFHARLNSTRPGTQTVIWCYDENLNGCFDENIQDTIVINFFLSAEQFRVRVGPARATVVKRFRDTLTSDRAAPIWWNRPAGSSCCRWRSHR